MNERERQLMESLVVWSRRRKVTKDEMLTIMGHMVAALHRETSLDSSELIQIVADRAKANLEAIRQHEASTAGGGMPCE